MIVTPNLQMYLPTQNNINDLGKGGLNWSNVGSPSFSDGVFGRTLSSLNGSNHINTNATNNPFNVVQEFTISFFVNIPNDGTNKAMLDIGAQTNNNIPSSNRGLAFWFVNSFNAFFIRIDNSLNGYQSSGNLPNQFGYYATDYEPPKNVDIFCAATRTPTQCHFYFFEEVNGYTKESFSYSAVNSTLNFANRINRVGALGILANDNSLNVTGNINSISHIKIWNKVLPESDIQRLIHNFHPLI